MDQVVKIKEWISEHIPMLSRVYENKYIGMLYDRFASLPARRQRQWLWGIIGGFSFLIFCYLLLAYYSLWSATSSTKEIYSMGNMLIQYQKQRRDKSGSIKSLSRNNHLAGPGQLKTHLLDIARSAGISPRMITAEENSDGSSSTVKNTTDINNKTATVSLSRVTLLQMTKYLKGIENGQYDLGISSMHITNDDKIRGYMKVELGIVAYLFQMDEN